jgi:dipeptidyl aminopeptidase/acylaminoacyl peptidase
MTLIGVATAAQRPLKVEDFDRMQVVAAPACSADGRWVAYTVDSVDTQADERRSRVWMVSVDGTQQLQLSAPERSAKKPRFSPDGRYLSFLAAQGAETGLYLLDRRGGEARRIGSLPGSVEDYDWSPDGRHIVLSMSRGQAISDVAHSDTAPEDAPPSKTKAPLVINSLHFKEDGTGYVTAADFPQLYLLEVSSGRVEALTTDRRFEDQRPVFSPDGSMVAYISDHQGDPARSGRREIYLIEARAGAQPQLLTEFFEPNYPSLHFTLDGRRLVYAEGLEPRLTAYIQDHLKVIDLKTKQIVPLAPTLDRALRWPVPISSDALVATVEDDGSEVPARVPLSGGPIERLLNSGWVANGLCAAAGHLVAVASTAASPPELYALEGQEPRRLTHHNDALMGELALAPVEDVHFPSRDGTEIHGMVVKPLGYQPGHRYPTILWIHGGPVGQDAHVLDLNEGYAPELDRQWFAAHGYLVLAVNYRGSSGRGAAFAQSIADDWGGKEVEDLRAAVDYAVRTGLADPDRLAIGGWSYGAILTDYTIASDPRFKAAIAGAGSGDQIATYGSDQYVMQYNAEVGPPWRAPERWIRLSYPFFHADRIHTPTFFLGGQADFNVPIVGGEQMYEALRTLGVSTQLVIYPEQHHVFTRPSYIRDRLQRYLDWYGRYLGG